MGARQNGGHLPCKPESRTYGPVLHVENPLFLKYRAHWGALCSLLVVHLGISLPTPLSRASVLPIHCWHPTALPHAGKKGGPYSIAKCLPRQCCRTPRLSKKYIYGRSVVVVMRQASFRQCRQNRDLQRRQHSHW